MLNKSSLIKFVLLVLGIIIIAYVIKPLFTKINKYQENKEMLKIIDSLKQESIILKQQQASLDSQNIVFEQKIQDLDVKLEEIKIKTTVVQQSHHTKIQSSKQYTTNQVDSFLRKRYGY